MTLCEPICQLSEIRRNKPHLFRTAFSRANMNIFSFDKDLFINDFKSFDRGEKYLKVILPETGKSRPEGESRELI